MRQNTVCFLPSFPLVILLNTQMGQVTYLRTKFMEALQTYQQVEPEYRANSRQRVERQYHIGAPPPSAQNLSNE